MPERFTFLTKDQIEKMGWVKSQYTEENLRPYREAVRQLGSDHQGATISLSENENPKAVKTLMRRAAEEIGLTIRFMRSDVKSTELHFVVLTPEQVERQEERQRKATETRRSKPRTKKMI